MTSKVRSGELPPWTALTSRSQSLRRRLEELVRDARNTSAAADGDPVSGSRKVEEEIRKWTEFVAAILDGLQPVVAKLRSDRTEFLEHLEERLRRELRKLGHDVFGDTSPLVVDGVVHVDIDKVAPSVSVNSETAEDLSIEGLSRLVQNRLAALQKDRLKPGAFLEHLADAYERELRISGRAPGSQVTTLSLLGHIMMARQSSAFRANPSSRTFREYTREQFRADLYDLLRSGKLEHEGTRFRYASGSDTVGAVFMFVPSLERTAHVGRVWFEPM